MMVPRASYHAHHDYRYNDDKDRGDHGHDKVQMRQDQLDRLFRGEGTAADFARGCDRT